MAPPFSALRAVLAANVRRIAAERELPLSHIADRAGLSRSHLWAILGCRRSATLDWLDAVAHTLDVSPLELLTEPPRASKNEARRR